MVAARRWNCYSIACLVEGLSWVPHGAPRCPQVCAGEVGVRSWRPITFPPLCALVNATKHNEAEQSQGYQGGTGATRCVLRRFCDGHTGLINFCVSNYQFSARGYMPRFFPQLCPSTLLVALRWGPGFILWTPKGCTQMS